MNNDLTDALARFFAEDDWPAVFDTDEGAFVVRFQGTQAVWTCYAYPIEDDQKFILELLETEKVLVVQGTGFNWPHPDHLRIVFLPNADDLVEAIGRIARFLESYRKRYGTH